MQPATRSSNQPLGQLLGGTSGDWRHRFLRFHVPLALASAAVHLLFMTLPLFDANAYPRADIVSGAFPQQRGEGGPMGHGGGQAGAMNPDEMMGSGSFARQFTTATGYVALGLLALTLLSGRPSSASST